MTTLAPFDSTSAILSIHAMINGFVLAAVEDVPESRMVEQPGGIINHPAWTLAHLNAYSGMLLSMFDDVSVPAATVETEMTRYGYGTVPVVDPAAYASKHRLLDQFKTLNARVAAVVAEKHADYFPRASPAKFEAYSPTIGQIAITLLIAHPPHHLGQLRQWRRAAGLSQQS